MDEEEIGDNLLYYGYNINNLLRLEKMDLEDDDPQYLSAFRSFEGEVFENFIYEKLIRYVQDKKEIKKFIVKGPHKKKTQALSSTLSVNSKGQIVYRTRNKEIGEFDAMMFTQNELYVVEMTLTKSITNLKRRLRKKKALLEILFPRYKIKALLILNEGVTGLKTLPDYCTTWVTKPFCAKEILNKISTTQPKGRRPFIKINSNNIIGTNAIDIKPFKYYSTLTWIMMRVREGDENVLDIDFLKTQKTTRLIDLFTKFYIGYMSDSEFKKLFPSITKDIPSKIAVSLEKEHTGELRPLFFMSHSKKNLEVVEITKSGDVKTSKKDPFGISVTEVFHISKAFKEDLALSVEDIKKLKEEIKLYTK